MGRKQRVRPCCEGESGSCEKSNKCSPNHRMPVRALRRFTKSVPPALIIMSESSNARQGIKTNPYNHKPLIAQQCPNHRMPVRALRLKLGGFGLRLGAGSESSNARQGIKTNHRMVLMMQCYGSESSNARQGIKTIHLKQSTSHPDCVRIIECPSGH